MNKKLLKMIINKIDWIMIIAGFFLTAFNLLNFSVTKSGGFYIVGSKHTPSGTYYYTEFTKILIAAGVILIVWGVLIYKNKEKVREGMNSGH